MYSFFIGAYIFATIGNNTLILTTKTKQNETKNEKRTKKNI